MSQPHRLLIAVMGPTGSGKTPLAEALADELGWEILDIQGHRVPVPHCGEDQDGEHGGDQGES